MPEAFISNSNYDYDEPFKPTTWYTSYISRDHCHFTWFELVRCTMDLNRTHSSVITGQILYPLRHSNSHGDDCLFTWFYYVVHCISAAETDRMTLWLKVRYILNPLSYTDGRGDDCYFTWFYYEYIVSVLLQLTLWPCDYISYTLSVEMQRLTCEWLSLHLVLVHCIGAVVLYSRQLVL